MFESLPDAFFLLAFGGLVAFVTTWFLSRAPKAQMSRHIRPENGVSFLYENQTLISASPAAMTLFSKDTPDPSWQDLFKKLHPSFPGFPDNPAMLDHSAFARLEGVGRFEGSSAQIERFGDVVSLTLEAPATEFTNIGAEPNAFALNNMPCPIWREDAAGEILYKNRAYQDLENRMGDTKGPIFSLPQTSESTRNQSRVSLELPEQDSKLWFDITTVKYGDEYLGYALDTKAIVDAESAQRNFVQTLAKTFAQLSIGLAIFDRNGQLALFNPALIDLTDLPADFLSARPTLLNFFDRLRDQRVMPEPKDYGTWRQEITELVEAASTGKYHETWSLPSGSIFSVSGRPHPDGAIAFLFEDITAEITLTRRFREELELGLSVMDKIDEAIVVFSSDGGVAYSNQPFKQMWNIDPDVGLARMSFSDVEKCWRDKTDMDKVWMDIRDYVEDNGPRTPFRRTLPQKDGQLLNCEVESLPNCATLVRLRTLQAAETGFSRKEAVTTN